MLRTIFFLVSVTPVVLIEVVKHPIDMSKVATKSKKAPKQKFMVAIDKDLTDWLRMLNRITKYSRSSIINRVLRERFSRGHKRLLPK